MENNGDKLNNGQDITGAFGGYISQITFNNGKKVDVSASDIVVIVGPNNVGKSQTLEDIYQLCLSSQNSSIIVAGIHIKKEKSSIKPYLEKFSRISGSGSSRMYSGLGYNSIVAESADTYITDRQYGGLRNFLVGYLTTLNRLMICEPVESIRRDEPYESPIHYAAFKEEYQKKLSEGFQKAFRSRIIPNQLFGSLIPLVIGDDIKFESENKTASAMIYAYADKLASYPQVQDQGDGIKSFVGIMLYLMIDHYRTLLIDEPESFLHPPQAKIMGEIIGQSLSEYQQAFISTHSEDIVKGLLEVCPERVKMIRVTRMENTNHFSVLENNNIRNIWNDPLLRHSNIMASLFHTTVVLCESDADCRLYSIIDSYLKQKEGHFSETMFIHCGGKHRMSKVVRALRELNIDVRLIPDLDVLNDEKIFKMITDSFDIPWNAFEKDYKILISNLNNGKAVKREDARAAIEMILNGRNDGLLSKKECRAIQDVVKKKSVWDDLKKSGVRGLPHGDAALAFQKIDAVLKEHGIYVVTVGELESFIPTVGGHGPNWVNAVLETYTDLDNSAYDEIKNFVKDMLL